VPAPQTCVDRVPHHFAVVSTAIRLQVACAGFHAAMTRRIRFTSSLLELGSVAPPPQLVTNGLTKSTSNFDQNVWS
jgi:hypothetical protein